ncbi:MAG: hypothetical protein KF791_07580 [Verrucomicrobiae bacterium]|nr:hypothetical protein [Verrucomicrobiae bacterium]
MNPLLRLATLTATATTLGLTGCSTFSNTKPSMSIDQIMDEGFKGKESLAARLGENTATSADKQRMVYLTQQLALNKPPMGDLASWEDKTSQLSRAAVALADRLPDSIEAWRSAANCKACHSIHKPD